MHGTEQEDKGGSGMKLVDEHREMNTLDADGKVYQW